MTLPGGGGDGQEGFSVGLLRGGGGGVPQMGRIFQAEQTGVRTVEKLEEGL